MQEATDKLIGIEAKIRQATQQFDQLQRAHDTLSEANNTLRQQLQQAEQRNVTLQGQLTAMQHDAAATLRSVVNAKSSPNQSQYAEQLDEHMAWLQQI